MRHKRFDFFFLVLRGDYGVFFQCGGGEALRALVRKEVQVYVLFAHCTCVCVHVCVCVCAGMLLYAVTEQS